MSRVIAFVALATLAAACGRGAPLPAASSAGPPAALIPPAPPASRTNEPPKLRLPPSARPLGYRLDLRLDPRQEAFGGQVEIDVELREPTARLWLNATDLAITKAELVAGDVTTPARVEVAPPELVALVLDVPKPAGRVTVRLAYQGKISTRDSDALFRQQEGSDWYAFTQFEDSSARRVFPCFDEPEHKVPFRITLRIRPDDVAVANTPIASMTEADGEKIVTFAPSKPLPTYLVAFAVGRFDLVDGGRGGQGGVPLRVVAERGRAKEASYAVATTPKIVAFLEEYFGLPYPYEKLDQIAVPRFGGAMENAGLITYGQSILLIAPEEETIARKKRYAVTAIHEIAHHWFGDLVTLAWWDDLWLNEAFATWMEDKAVAVLEPTWDAPVSLVHTRAAAMASDSLATARKIRQPIVTKDDINDAFDGITYDKGSAILTMFERWIGPEKFQQGIRRYLADHAHGVATTKDFLGAISAAAGVDVAPMFSSFLDQPGAPLLTVRLECEADAPPRLAVRQERYLPVGSKGAAKETWQVPVCARWSARGKEGRDCGLIAAAEGRLPLSAPSCPDWVLPNEAMIGYYRTRYDGDLLERLLKAWKKLTVPEQVGVVGDVAALVTSAHLPLERALGLVPLLARDKNRHLTGAAAQIVGFLSDEVVPPELRPKRARFIKKTFGARARALGWKPKKGERDDERLLRPTLLRLMAVRAEDPADVAEAKRLADRWLADEKSVDPDLVTIVLDVAATHGDRAFFDRLHEAAKKEQDRKRRTRLISAMGSFRDPAIMKGALELTLGDELEPRESIALLWGALDTEETREQAWAFLKANLDRLLPRLPRDYGSRFIGASDVFCDPAHRAEIEAFFAPRAGGWLSGPRELAQTLEDVDLCIARKAAQAEDVAEFLAKY